MIQYFLYVQKSTVFGQINGATIRQDNALLMSMEFGMANQYILDLSLNTEQNRPCSQFFGQKNGDEENRRLEPVFKNRKIEFETQTQYAAPGAARENSGKIPLSLLFVGRVGIEPTTISLKGCCSTD